MYTCRYDHIRTRNFGFTDAKKAFSTTTDTVKVVDKRISGAYLGFR